MTDIHMDVQTYRRTSHATVTSVAIKIAECFQGLIRLVELPGVRRCRSAESLEQGILSRSCDP